MKLYKISTLVMGALALGACSDIDEQLPESGNLTAEQIKESNAALASRMEASFNGMYSMMGKPLVVYGVTSSGGRADDFGFIASALSQDLEGADVTSGDNGYNWFSAACELATRNPDYANPYARYTLPYRQIGVANQVISDVASADAPSATDLAHAAEAHAVRAFDYMSLAPYFQGSYATSKDKPCVPIISDSLASTCNARATVAEVYALILSDLNYAIENLEGYTRKYKWEIDQQVAYGLRARAYLAMGEYAKAAEDAEKAMKGYTPASISDVSVPAFCDISESNWMWGIDVTDAQVNTGGADNSSYATASSWISAFSADGYAAATGNTPRINKLLFDKIPATDVRKGWWLDENCHSDNWATLSWDDAVGDEIASYKITDVKLAFDPYTNIKFGMQSGIGSTLNNNDWPLMRVEEMILIQAEGLAKSGQEARAQQILENFVKTYRDPSYSVSAGGRTLADEIWFQRRVELWGEGFFTADARRLGKNIVRFHEGQETNLDDAFVFNIAADDAWLNMRFPTSETDNNLGIVNNTGGSQPVAGQNGSLRDGVTD